MMKIIFGDDSNDEGVRIEATVRVDIWKLVLTSSHYGSLLKDYLTIAVDEADEIWPCFDGR